MTSFCQNVPDKEYKLKKTDNILMLEKQFDFVGDYNSLIDQNNLIIPVEPVT
jgi:hypothetical protein